MHAAAAAEQTTPSPGHSASANPRPERTVGDVAAWVRGR